MEREPSYGRRAQVPIFAGRDLLLSRLKITARYYMGVDLGQTQDHTAITIIERAEVVLPTVNPVTWENHMETRFHLRYAERIPLGLSYPDIVAHVKHLAERSPLKGFCTVVVD